MYTPFAAVVIDSDLVCILYFVSVFAIDFCFLPLQNPGVSDVYIEHSVQATVAQYAPSGYYIASGGKHAHGYIVL